MQPRSRLLPVLLSLPLLLSAACGGGGGGGAAPTNPGTPPSSALQLVLDPATGSDAFVEVQVAAAALQRPDGSFTANLLAGGVMLTLADPTGEPQGLLLPSVPAGSYRELHLMLAPGSGSAVLADARTVPVDFASADLAVRFASDVAHDGVRSTWVAARHTGTTVPQPAANGRIGWAPQLAGGAANGTPVTDAALRVLMVQNGGVIGGLNGTDDRGVHLEFEPGVELFDDRGGRVADPAAFLAGLSASNTIRVTGALDDHGGLRGQRVRIDDRGGSGPRLLGRIVALAPASSAFTMDVLAEVQNGDRVYLGTPQRVTVQAGNARIHHSDTLQALTFGDLLAGDLVKVRWSSRNGNDVTASEVELESRSGSAASPEIEGRVSEVRAAENLIVVVPRGNDPLMVSGQSLPRAEIAVTASTQFERRESSGARAAIQLGDIVANQDRIWIRGTATGPAAVTATWIRVRAD